MKFCVVMWCDDCTGQDFEGCFNGLVDRLYFDTIEDARAYIQRLGYQEPLHAILEEKAGADLSPGSRSYNQYRSRE